MSMVCMPLFLRGPFRMPRPRQRKLIQKHQVVGDFAIVKITEKRLMQLRFHRMRWRPAIFDRNDRRNRDSGDTRHGSDNAFVRVGAASYLYSPMVLDAFVVLYNLIKP